MDWSPEQERALQLVDAWLKVPVEQSQVFRLFGHAGTGKTTLAQHLAPSGTLFGAYTGKAAHVLRSKGCEDARTLHALIYLPMDKCRARLRLLEEKLAATWNLEEFPDDAWERPLTTAEQREFWKQILEERAKLAQPAFQKNQESPLSDPDTRLLIVDEASMVEARMAEDLLSFRKKILVLGDPAQLPPVYGAGYFTDAPADLLLTEIHRQAKDNPIIQLATLVREGKGLPAAGSYGESQILDRPERALLAGLAQQADQILVGKNNTRRNINQRCRALMGLEDDPLPVPGDKVVCLRNNNQIGLLNGSLWSVVAREAELSDKTVRLELDSLDGTPNPLDVLKVHTHHFMGNENHLGFWEQKDAEAFDYGYALTVHKSQGSSWEDVLLFDESRCFRQDGWRWLYTGITRASERITVVRI